MVSCEKREREKKRNKWSFNQPHEATCHSLHHLLFEWVTFLVLLRSQKCKINRAHSVFTWKNRVTECLIVSCCNEENSKISLDSISLHCNDSAFKCKISFSQTEEPSSQEQWPSYFSAPCFSPCFSSTRYWSWTWSWSLCFQCEILWCSWWWLYRWYWCISVSLEGCLLDRIRCSPRPIRRSVLDHFQHFLWPLQAWFCVSGILSLFEFTLILQVQQEMLMFLWLIIF